MEITQLEIDLTPYLETAQAFPEAAEMSQLCDLIERAIADKPLSVQLEEAGNAIAVLSGVLADKFEQTIDHWQQKHCPTEPIVIPPESLFTRFQDLDLDEFFEEPEHFYPSERESATRCGSVVVEVEPDVLADAMEAEIPDEQALQQALELAHGEDVEEWVAIVRSALEGQKKLTFRALKKRTGLAIVPLWVALLFGGFSLEREGDFYEGRILILGQNEKLSPQEIG